MAPRYEVVMITQSGASVTPRITSFLKETAKQLWGTGAVIADLKSWGNRALAYRIRQKGVNHYHAQYIGLHVYCSPKALQGLEERLRNEDLVLRWMSLKERSLPRLTKEARHPFRQRGLAEPADLAADAMEAAKYEYRNMVMQRIFQGRTEQELLSEQMTQSRFAQNQARSSLASGASLLDMVRGGGGGGGGGGSASAIEPASEPAALGEGGDAPPPSPDSDRKK